MKRCPTCGTTYTDGTLRFCLADGAPLTDAGSEQPTVVRGSGGSAADPTIAMHGRQIRVDVPQDAPAPPPQYPSIQPAPSRGSGGLLKVLLVIFGLGIFVVLAALIAAFAYLNMRPESANVATDVKTPAPSPAATRNATDELRDQIANLQKQLADRTNTGRPANSSITLPAMPSSTSTTARVNSPGDGFLALRTLPSSELGDRILKIPHGAMVSIGGCGPVMRPVSKSGRWCQASYGGRSGWVFDAYLVY